MVNPNTMIERHPESGDIDVERIVAEIRTKVRQRAKAVAEQPAPLTVAEGRAEFSEKDYLALNPDVAATVAAGSCRSGWEHWLTAGRAEGRAIRKPALQLRNAAALGITAQPGTNAELMRKVKIAASQLETQCFSIGLPPPGPRTLRSRVSSLLMGLISKSLWWYTHSIREFVTLSNTRNSEITHLLEILLSEQSRARETVRLLQDTIAGQNQTIATLRRTTSGIVDFAPSDASREKLDKAYVAFQNTFRGSRDEIRARQTVYVPLLRGAGAGSPEAPVLDIGCGRGEWLEALRDHGMEGRGIDRNLHMVAACRDLGLFAEQADALAYLEKVPDESLGAVTSFHLIEHVPFEMVMALIDNSLRVLRKGGILLLETPNPENLLVGAQTFYIDPSHLHPIPSQTLRFFVEHAGFADVVIERLHPYPDSARLPAGSSDIAGRLNDMFYGPQDYAVIGRKPA